MPRAAKPSPRPYVSKTQSVVLPKDTFSTKAKARAELKAKGFRSDLIEDSGKTQEGNYWRARQFAPTRGLPKRMHPIGHHGIMLVEELWPRPTLGSLGASVADEAIANRGKRRPKKRDMALLGTAAAAGLAAGAGLDNLIPLHPLGVAPSRYALVGTFLGALYANYRHQHEAALALATASAGVGVGIIGEAIYRARKGGA